MVENDKKIRCHIHSIMFSEFTIYLLIAESCKLPVAIINFEIGWYSPGYNLSRDKIYSCCYFFVLNCAVTRGEEKCKRHYEVLKAYFDPWMDERNRLLLSCFIFKKCDVLIINSNKTSNIISTYVRINVIELL